MRAVAVTAAAAALCLGPLPLAIADGPGYGGDAGQLAVTWESTTSAGTSPADTSQTFDSTTPVDTTPPVDATVPASAAPLATEGFGGGGRGVGAAFALPPAADPQLQPDGLALMVRGLGFRSKAKIEVRIGSDQPVLARADSAGALAVALDPGRLGGAQPGVSVMAVGRNQSGTEVTLFGSIPPVADGSGPMSLVPWAAASIAVAGLAVWARRRHARHAESNTSGHTGSSTPI